MNGAARSAVESSLPARFEMQARLSAGRIALRSDEVSWTYRELNSCANLLARRLLPPAGTEPSPVPLLIGQGALEIVALLAVLKSGRAYVALDPQAPLPRLRQIVADVGAAQVLAADAHAELAARLVSRVVVVPAAADLLAALSEPDLAAADHDNLNLDIDPGALASLVYTSGSTGTPKGVMRSHRCSLHRCWLFQHAHRVGSNDRIAHLFSCGYVAAEVDVYGALLSGATLCCYPTRDLGLGPLAEWLAAEKITLLHPPTALWRRFLDREERPLHLPSLRVLFLGGEAVFRRDVERVQRLLPGCAIEHRLSSSEASIFARNVINPGEECQTEVVPVGFPVPDKEVLLLDHEGREVPPGETGEIAVLSRYLSPGYWRRPELTAEKFVPVPAGGEEGPLPLVRFHTGDLGRFSTAAGPLHHLGRIDAQVKVHGHRIEPQEVEAALLRLGTLKEAAVFGAPDEQGEQHLVGVVVPIDPGTWSEVETRRLLAERIPYAMVPAHLVATQELPSTASGKIDRQRLAAEHQARRGRSRAAPAAPGVRLRGRAGLTAEGTAAADLIAGIWAQVLQLERVGLDDHFYQLGGDSLAGARLLTEVNQALGGRLPATALYRISTVREMVQTLAPAGREGQESLPPPGQPGAPALSRSEYRSLLAVVGGGRIPCVRPGSLIKASNTGGSRPPLFWCFNAPDAEMSALSGRLGGDQPVYGLYSGSGQLSGDDRVIARIGDHYAEEALALFPEGPFAIGGNCRGAKVACALALRLAALGREVSHLCLMEFFHPALFAYPGRVLLLYGRQSRHRAYRPFRWGRQGWALRFRRVPEVDWIPGEHGQFFTPKNVDRLAARLRAFLQGGTRASAAALSPASRALLLVHRMTWFFEAYVRAARFGRSAS